MAVGAVEAASVTIYPSAGALAADNNLRIASLTMAAYEYVVDWRSRPFVGTHTIRIVISSPSLQNTGYISPAITEG